MRNKSRLTITIQNDLLSKIDALVDRRTIRNRSHAIENLILQSLGTKISKAVILAGGESNKEEISCLKKIKDRYLLSITLEHLKNFGLNEIIICSGKNGQKIEEIFGDGSAHGLKIIYSSEEKPLGTAGALKKIEKNLKTAPFLVLHSDTFTNLNISDFINFHLAEGTLATIAVKPRLSEEKYGQVFMQGNKIVRFLAKGAIQGISIINTGIYIFDPKILNLISKDKKTDLETDIFPILAEKEELSAFIFQGMWHDISEDKDYKEAVRQLEL